ncbi:MAG: hypothetical protein KBD37_03950 [Burkholderiales bacterium]|nr:hypothetical protein [Burkholderiales bacterium]
MGELNCVSAFRGGFTAYEKKQQQAAIKSEKFKHSTRVISSAELPNVSLVEGIIKATKRNPFQRLLDFLTGTKRLSVNEAQREAVSVALAFVNKENDLKDMLKDKKKEPLLIYEGDGYDFSAKYVENDGLKITMNINAGAGYDVDGAMHSVVIRGVEKHDFATFRGTACLNSFIKNCNQDVIEYCNISEVEDKFCETLRDITKASVIGNAQYTELRPASLEENGVDFLTQVFEKYCQFEHKSYSANWKCKGDLSKVREGKIVKLKLSDNRNSTAEWKPGVNSKNDNVLNKTCSNEREYGKLAVILASERNLNDITSEKNLNNLSKGGDLDANTEFIQVVDSKNKKYYFHNLGNNRYRRLAINDKYAHLDDEKMAEKLNELPIKDIFENYSPNEKLASLIKKYVEFTEQAIAILSASRSCNADLIATLRLNLSKVNALRDDLIAVKLSKVANVIPFVYESKDVSINPAPDKSRIVAGNKNGLVEKNPYQEMEFCISAIPGLAECSDIIADPGGIYRHAGATKETRSQLPAMITLGEQLPARADQSLLFIKNAIESYLGWGESECTRTLSYEKGWVFEGDENSLFVYGDSIKKTDNNGQSINKEIVDIVCATHLGKDGNIQKLQQGFKDAYDKKTVSNGILLNSYIGEVTYSGEEIIKNDYNYGLKYTGEAVEFDCFGQTRLNGAAIQKNGQAIEIEIPIGGIVSIEIDGVLTFLERIQDSSSMQTHKKIKELSHNTQKYRKIIPNSKFTQFSAEQIGEELKYNVKRSVFSNCDRDNNLWLNMDNIKKDGKPIIVPPGHKIAIELATNRRLYLQATGEKKIDDNCKEKYKVLELDETLPPISHSELSEMSKYTINLFAKSSSGNSTNKNYVNRELCENILQDKYPAQFKKEAFKELRNKVRYRGKLRYEDQSGIVNVADIIPGTTCELPSQSIFHNYSIFQIRSFHKQKLKELNISLGKDEEKVNKDELRKRIERYEDFDLDSFNKLSDTVTIAEVLDSLKKPSDDEMHKASIIKRPAGDIPKGHIIHIQINDTWYYLECLSYAQDGKQSFKVLRRKTENELSPEVQQKLIKEHNQEINFSQSLEYSAGTDLFEHSTQAAYVDLDAVLSIMGSYGSEKAYFQHLNSIYIRVMLKPGINEQDIEGKIKNGEYSDVFYMPWQNHNVGGGLEWGYAKELEQELIGLHEDRKLIYASTMPTVFKIADGVTLTREEMKKMERYNSLSIILDKITKATISGEAAAESLKVMNLQAKILMFRYDYEDKLQENQEIPDLHKKVYTAFSELKLPDTQFIPVGLEKSRIVVG